MRSLHAAILGALCLWASSARSGGNVYFVIGSDTGIWDGLDVSKYHCTIGGTLYTDPTRNAARVMDPAFRGAMVDYYGTPMKLTWWMMAGNMFRYSVNTDIPTPSTMPIYLMKRYEGEGVQQWGDELTFHFHDWIWSDENGDGIWYWNQAPAFSLAANDFDQTLAEMLIEEDLFPVSFRSGWHAMDNTWQHRLNELLPFSMHNDYPGVHADSVEPIDNVYDWSRAPSTNIPFHPSTTDYQVPGDGPGWNLRSRYMSVADSAFMAGVFAKASAGVDQVVCLWAHLPETDFPDNLEKVNRSAHAASGAFPLVPYRYCTAVEAMQRWLGTSDTTRPVILLEEYPAGNEVGWKVTVSEPIFQPAPVFTVKDRYEEHRLIPMVSIGPMQWQTSQTVPRNDLAAIAVAVTDSSGNHATQRLRYLPEDVYVDNGDPGYEEVHGTWSTVALSGWGASYRAATVTAGDSVSVRWTAEVSADGKYSAFLRFPSTSARADSVHITVFSGAVLLDTLLSGEKIVGDRWTFLTTADLNTGAPFIVTVTSHSTGVRSMTADVLRLTPLVKELWLTAPDIFDIGEVVVGTDGTGDVDIRNEGITPGSILSARMSSGVFAVNGIFPRVVPAMGAAAIQLQVTPTVVGALQDTLILTTDDAHHPELRILITAHGRNYFVVVDDGDSTGYTETGIWSFSNAQAYRTTSRYAYPAAGTQARFQTVPSRAGQYDISEIVPTTVNASDRARYVLSINGNAADSVFINQNTGSGSWVHLMTAGIRGNDTVAVTVTDAMSPVISGRVLRADAMQFQWVADTISTTVHDSEIPVTTVLLQNYPNPFNPVTVIEYTVGGVRGQGSGVGNRIKNSESSIHNSPEGQGSGVGVVQLGVYDILGREVAVLVNEMQYPGRYTVAWNAKGMASGVYFYRLQAGDVVDVKRLILLR